MSDIIISAVIGLVVSVPLVVVWWLGWRESNRLAALAGRLGMDYSRRDRFGIGVAVEERLRGRRYARFSRVRDVIYDSRIRLFRCAEALVPSRPLFGAPQFRPALGVMAEAPSGPDITVETTRTGVGQAYSAPPYKDMSEDSRTRAIAECLAANPSPHPIAVVIMGGVFLAFYWPDGRAGFGRSYYYGDYRYLADFAHNVL